MERLTERDDKGNLLFSGKQVYAGDFYEAASCLEEYEDTGLTPEQIRELKVRDTVKAPVDIDDEFDMYVCPSCNMAIGTIGDKRNHHFCLNCGQRLKFKEDIQ